MLRQRNIMTTLLSRSVWLAMALVAIVPILYFASLASAQEISTPFTQKPTVTAESMEGGIRIEWVAVQDAVLYQLHAYTTATGWYEIGGVNLTGTSFIHERLTRGSQIWYSVRAVDAQGKLGPFSIPVYSLAGPVLPAPVLTATVKEGVIELGWSAVPGAARYELWADGGKWVMLDEAIETTKYQHSSATAGTEYLYTVAAIDDEGIGGSFLRR